jgi:hypothetical protein
VSQSRSPLRPCALAFTATMGRSRRPSDPRADRSRRGCLPISTSSPVPGFGVVKLSIRATGKRSLSARAERPPKLASDVPSSTSTPTTPEDRRRAYVLQGADGREFKAKLSACADYEKGGAPAARHGGKVTHWEPSTGALQGSDESNTDTIVDDMGFI